MTSTSNPPVLDDASLGTPAKEWADHTTSALGSPQPAPSTPAHDLPGAFPSLTEIGSFSTQGVGESLVGTARTYLPQSVINTLDNYLGTHASSTVQSSSNDVPHQPSLPTQEGLGAKPGEKVDGVGSLPGTNSESGVAKLPDERSAEAGEETHTAAAKETSGQTPPAGVLAASKGGNDISLPSQEVVGARPYENVSGVGALPGPSTETGVAELPDQRNAEHGEITPGSGTVDQAREAVGQIRPVAFDIKPISKNKDNSIPTEHSKPDGVGISTDGKSVSDASGDHKTPAHETQRDPQSSTEGTGSNSTGAVPSNVDNKSKTGQFVAQLEPRIYPLGGDGAKWNGVGLGPRAVDRWEQTAASSKDLPPEPKSMPAGESSMKRQNGAQRSSGDEGGSHPPELHPTNGKYCHASEDDNKSALSDARPGSTQSGGSQGGSPKKVGFKEKVSGRSKVLMGKLGHNPEKVEEGKRILHGET